MPREWSVGEVADRAGVSVRTLHHYDAVGLVTPTRTAAGHRRYTDDDVSRLAQVVALRSVGLALEEVQRCLDGGESLLTTSSGNGIPTHFVGAVDDVTFRARDIEMLPLELVARRYAVGSFGDRFPDLVEGTVLEDVAFEIFEKDDARHDPLLEFDFDRGVVRRYVPNKQAAQAIGSESRAGDLLHEEPLQGSRYVTVTPGSSYDCVI